MKPNPKPEPKPDFVTPIQGDGGSVLVSRGDGTSASIDPYAGLDPHNG